MSNDQKPREFVVSVFKLRGSWSPQVWFDYPEHYELDSNWEYFKVKEVLPPEPSLEIEVEMKKLADEQWNFLQADRDKWKSLCEKLVHEFRNGTISSINMAISEYEKECK